VRVSSRLGALVEEDKFDLLWRDRSSVDLTPGSFAITLAPFCIMFEWILQRIHPITQGACFSSRGHIVHNGSCEFGGLDLRIAWRFHRVSYPRSTVWHHSSEGLEAIFKEAEILVPTASEGALCREKISAYSQSKDWILKDHLYSAWRTIGGSFLHHSIVFWRHYQPHTSYFLYVFQICSILYEVSYYYK
jgi:hypothetical protein